jgi:hypothetical protein
VKFLIETPDEVGPCDTPGNALGVALAGDHAYVAESVSIRRLYAGGSIAPERWARTVWAQARFLRVPLSRGLSHPGR